MKVKEVVLAGATELGVADDVAQYLEGVSDEGKAEAENLLRCYNLVENELALDYLPLLFEEELETQTGAVFFSELARKAVRILKVSDEYDNVMAFTLFPQYLKTQPGKIKIRYSYTPTQKGFDDECECALGVSARLMGYGVAAEHALASGLYEEAAVLDRKYKDAVKAVYHAKPSRKIRARRWV